MDINVTVSKSVFKAGVDLKCLWMCVKSLPKSGYYGWIQCMSEYLCYNGLISGKDMLSIIDDCHQRGKLNYYEYKDLRRLVIEKYL